MGPNETFSFTKATHEVLLYRTERRADVQFDQFPMGYVLGTVTHSSRLYWAANSELQAGPSADEFWVKCYGSEYGAAPEDGGTGCYARARYGRILSNFVTDISARGLSEDELAGILQVIEERMLQCVETLEHS